MHSFGGVGLGSFQGVMVSSDVLQTGGTYTFTFSINQLLITTSDIEIQNKLQYFMQNYGDISSVVRPIFSGRFVVTVVPKASYSLSAWLSAFNYSWSNIPGYEGVTFLTVEGGATSSVPGGLPGVAIGAGQQIKMTLPDIDLSKYLPYLIGGAVILVGIAMLPNLFAFRRGYARG